MIEIVNMKTYKGEGFKVDRTTPLGNPYFMKDETQRDKCCIDYKKYFYSCVNNSLYPLFNTYLYELIAHYKQHKTLTLKCWCAPKQCHAETIKEYILSIT
jgi:hypothetical protein